VPALAYSDNTRVRCHGTRAAGTTFALVEDHREAALPTNTPRAEARITRRDIVRLVSVGGSTAAEAPVSQRRTVKVRRAVAPEPVPEPVPASQIPPSRKSAIRLKRDDDALPYAVVDIVTADLSNDPRRED
jgi:hypothetical protein